MNNERCENELNAICEMTIEELFDFADYCYQAYTDTFLDATERNHYWRLYCAVRHEIMDRD